MREEVIKIGNKLIENRDRYQDMLEKVENSLERDDIYIAVKTKTSNPLFTITEEPMVQRALSHYASYLKSQIAVTNQQIQELDDEPVS